MRWSIRHIFNFPREKLWGSGYAQFGFHDNQGNQYMLQWSEHWLGHLAPDDRFLWTAGSVDKGLSALHIAIDVVYPHYISNAPDNSLLLSSNGNNRIYKIYPAEKSAELFIDTGKLGLRDIGNCFYDTQGILWVHKIRGCKVWQFNEEGKPIRSLGDGTPGFQKEAVSFDEVRFNWIYDMRLGPDGNIYILDSKNFVVRMVDPFKERVATVIGTGQSGPAADDVDALETTLGSHPAEYFDGPWSLAIDEVGNIFIGDTYNHVVRMVRKANNRIHTIAGNAEIQHNERNHPQETDPLSRADVKSQSVSRSPGYETSGSPKNSLTIAGGWYPLRKL